MIFKIVTIRTISNEYLFVNAISINIRSKVNVQRTGRGIGKIKRGYTVRIHALRVLR